LVSSPKDKPPFLVALWHFIRPVNLIMTAISLWVFRWCVFAPFLDLHGLDHHLSNTQFGRLVLSVVLVTLSGYWINDRADIQTDQINHPHRLLVRFSLSSYSFYALWLIPVLAGLLLSIHLATDLDMLHWLWLYPFSIVAFVVYAFFLKRSGLAGNILVSLWIAALPWLVFLAESNVLSPSESLIAVLIFYSVLMFCSNLAREWVKDIQDLHGDRESGMHTWPIRAGTARVWKAAGGALLVCALSCLWFMMRYVPPRSLLSLCLLVAAAAGTALAITSFYSAEESIGQNQGRRLLRKSIKPEKMSLYLKLYMLFGLFVLLLLPEWCESL
jgi:4-hydroxybenzoate polyprenyltransferase